VRKQRSNGTPGEQPDECDPHHLPAEQRTSIQRDSHAHPTAMTAPPETPATTLHHPAKHGEEPPILTSRPTSLRRPQPSEPL
ncbi:Hypothetical protein GSB_151284, partial [Giardia duodenalis]